MSKGGGTTSSIDSRIFPLLQQNYKTAQGVASQPFTPYTGQLAPAVPQATTTAINSATGLTGYTPQQVTAPMATAPTSQAASSGVFGLGSSGGQASAAPIARPNISGMSGADRRTALGDWRAQKQAARGPAGPGAGAPSVSAMQGLQGMESYLNPYTDQVVNATLADINRQNQIANVGNSQAATMSGAWGGSRHGIAEAETNRAYGDIAAQTAAGLRNQGFNTSAGLLMQDKGNLLQNQQFNAGLQQQTNLANQQAGLSTALANQQAGLTGALANQSSGLAGAGLNLAATNALGNLGQQQYAMNQDQTAAQYNEFLRSQAYPYQQQGLLNSSLGMMGNLGGTQSYQMPNYTAGSTNIANAGTLGKASVICTELHRRGMIGAEMLRHADTYGARYPTVRDGYRVWGVPVARLMRKSDRFARIVKRLTLPLIVKLEDGGPDWTPAGVALGVGVAICWLIGVLTRKPRSRVVEA